MIDQRKITIVMAVEDMGRISIALDTNQSMYSGSPEWKSLQEKWDKMYRGVHAALEAGVVQIKLP